MKTVLTIAGSDPSGGAGIQADLKTMEAHGVYGMSVITALTAQNTMGVSGKLPIPADFVRAQLRSVHEDIFPDGVKIGMLPDQMIMRAVKDTLLSYEHKNIVLDPVLGSTSGTAFSSYESREYLMRELFPVCTLITPNVPEAEILAGRKINSETVLENAAKALGDAYGCSVLIKGGHFTANEGFSDDCLYHNGAFEWISAQRIDNPNTHGTGCTLSSAIACNLALGFELTDAVKRAKQYLTGCIEKRLDLGKGRGPLEHRV